KDEDQFAQAELEGGAEVESEKRSRGVWQREQMVGPMGEADRNAGESDGDNAEQDRAGNAAGHEGGGDYQAGRGEQGLRVGSLAESDERGGMGDDHLCVAQPDEGDKQPNAGGGAVFQAIRNAVDDLFADVGESEKQEEQAGEEHDGQSGLPGYA